MNKPSTPLCAIEVTESVSPYPKKSSLLTLLFRKTLTFTWLILIVLFCSTEGIGQAYCTMICNDEISVSVGINCEAAVYYNMILEDGDNPRLCSPNGKWGFKIFVFDENNNELPTSPTIPFEYVGSTLKAKAKHWATGNICWTTVHVVDKIFPKLECPSEVTISCTESAAPERTGYPTASDCSEVSYTYTDNHIDLNCGNPLARIERQWTVVDGSGNMDYCTQIINIAQPSVQQVVFPQNLDGLELPVLECEWVAVDPASLLPENTGIPTINGKAIASDGPCRLIPSYEDQKVESCEGTYKILRTWTVVNWCSSEIITDVQIIKVVDPYGPTIEISSDLTFSTTKENCTATVTLPAATVMDGCASTVSVSVQSSMGNLMTNGGSMTNIPIGMHTATYLAVDACGNTSSKDIQIKVIDEIPPTVICEDQTVISLSTDGEASAYVQSFDNGTFDNCCLDGLGVRRLDSPDTPFGQTVSFNCEDVGEIVMVVLEARDCYENANTCMVEVTIQDKVNPTITCPASKTIDCEEEQIDLSIYGEAQAQDNCGYDLAYEVLSELDNCGTGTITRKWTATDKNDRVSTCEQLILVTNATPWNQDGKQIIWPADYESTECLDGLSLLPEDLPAGNGEPQIQGAAACELIATNYEDLVLGIEPPACYKVLRSWTVIDWCNYDVNNPDAGGIFKHTQIIKVLDNINPEFETMPADVTVNATGENCGASIEIPTVTVKDCSPNTTVSVQGDLGNGYGPFSDVGPGNYKMTYIAADGCGNTTSKEITITVIDEKKPTPVCLAGIALTVMPQEDTLPMVELWATDLNQKSYDNCTPDEDLRFTIRAYDALDDSVPTTDNIFFNCEHLGVQAVEVWVTDADGNADYCITSVVVQDNMKACETTYTDDKGMVAVGGKIMTPFGATLTDVEVHISDPEQSVYMTKDDGVFHFDDVATTQDYTVAPFKNTQPLNGVSTFDLLLIRKHILKIELLDSPYKLIAADVNKSGKVTTFDLVELRKLILGIYDAYPDNTSWRFVLENYEFQNVVEAASEDFPESFVVQDLETDFMDLAFIAIKIGDVDFSASERALRNTTSRNTKSAMTFAINDPTFEAGEEVIMNLTTPFDLALAGYQFALQFDSQVLTYTGYTAAANMELGVQNFGLRELSKGYLTTSWEDVNGLHLKKGASLVQLKFKARKAGKLSDVLQLNADKLPPEIYTNTKEEALTINKLALQYNAATPKGLALFQNQPNPFSTETMIGFNLPKAKEAILSIYDANGRQLFFKTGQYEKGYNEIAIEKNTLSGSGVYYYTLQTNEQQLVRKMLVR